jgi:hypothetical protein
LGLSTEEEVAEAPVLKVCYVFLTKKKKKSQKRSPDPTSASLSLLVEKYRVGSCGNPGHFDKRCVSVEGACHEISMTLMSDWAMAIVFVSSS